MEENFQTFMSKVKRSSSSLESFISTFGTMPAHQPTHHRRKFDNKLCILFGEGRPSDQMATKPHSL
eukprot:747895-Hanusia_phi.AAC.1